MTEPTRSVMDVIGTDKDLLSYWDKIPDRVKNGILNSNAQVTTLGELQILSSQLNQILERPPQTS